VRATEPKITTISEAFFEVVRSEGGRIYCDFNGLRKWA
jgi:hypothetical protein